MLGREHRDLTVARFIDRTGLNRIVETARRREDCATSAADHSRDGGAARGERAQIRSSLEARIVFEKVRTFLLRGRRRDGGPGVADLEPVLLVVSNHARRKRQHGLPCCRVVADRGRVRRGDRLVESGDQIDFKQLVGRNCLSRGLIERILAVEVDRDRVAVLRKAAADASDGLRHDRHHERPEIKAEVDGRRVTITKCFNRRRTLGHGLQTTTDHDPIAVIRQGVLEPDHDLILVRCVVDQQAARIDGDVEFRATGTKGIAGAAAADDRDIVRDGGRIDVHARAEPEGELLRRLVQRVSRLPNHEEWRVAAGVGRHHVERHDPPFLKLLHLLVAGTPCPLAPPPPRRHRSPHGPPRALRSEHVFHRSQPRRIDHEIHPQEKRREEGERTRPTFDRKRFSGGKVLLPVNSSPCFATATP